MALSGPQPVAPLLCKLKDTAATEPHPASFYKDLVRRGTGGLNDYWAAASLGAINLDGSKVLGWKTFDIHRADYLDANPSRADKINDAVARFDVDLSGFARVIALFNVDMTAAVRRTAC